MELTPLDLRNQTFAKKTFGGFDPEEVHAFLNQAAGELEKQSRQRTELSERLKIAEERVNFYKQLEKTLQDSVLTMQKTVDDIKHNADREAELIIAEAKARAIREVEETKKRSDDLRSEIEVLKQQKTNYFIRIRALIRGQEELLEAMEREHTEHKSPEDLAAEAMIFRNKRLEQAAVQRKTGAHPIVQQTQALPTVQSRPMQAQAPVPHQSAPQYAPQLPPQPVAQPMQQPIQQPAQQSVQQPVQQPVQPQYVSQTQAMPTISAQPQQPQPQQTQAIPTVTSQNAASSNDPWNNPWGPYGQPPVKK